jgi:hypothetical protein
VDDKEMIRRVKALLPEVAVKATEEPIGKKKEWQDLTNKEFAEILCDDRWQFRPELMLLATQAKLREKNSD